MYSWLWLLLSCPHWCNCWLSTWWVNRHSSGLSGYFLRFSTTPKKSSFRQTHTKTRGHKWWMYHSLTNRTLLGRCHRPTNKVIYYRTSVWTALDSQSPRPTIPTTLEQQEQVNNLPLTFLPYYIGIRNIQGEVRPQNVCNVKPSPPDCKRSNTNRLCCFNEKICKALIQFL